MRYRNIEPNLIHIDALAMERNQGKFYISSSALDHGSDVIVKLLIAMEFLPLRVEYRADMNAFEYIGISPMFKSIHIGQTTPSYDIIITRYDDEGKPTKHKYEVIESKEKS